MPVSPLFNPSDSDLNALINEGLGMQVADPVLNHLKEMLLELALRLREIRNTALLNAVEHNGTMWVRAETVIKLLDGGT